MSANSKIEWTDHTANFWWGCVKVSPGCQNCYAETLVNRYQGDANIWGPAKTTRRQRKKGIWKELPRWNEKAKAEGVRRRVFVQSMSDFFEDHPDVSGWRAEAIDLMERCTWLDFQVLTKRPENIPYMVPDHWMEMGDWPGNVWIGTSVEDQKRADERIPVLLTIPALVRFLSVEPLLEHVNLEPYLQYQPFTENYKMLFGGREFRGIQWVIVGGESGPRKRPFDIAWARAVRDQVTDSHASFFMKQIDKVQPIPDDLMIREFPED